MCGGVLCAGMGMRPVAVAVAAVAVLLAAVAAGDTAPQSFSPAAFVSESEAVVGLKDAVQSGFSAGKKECVLLSLSWWWWWWWCSVVTLSVSCFWFVCVFVSGARAQVGDSRHGAWVVGSR